MDTHEIRTLPYEVRRTDSVYYHLHLYFWGLRHPRSSWFYLLMIVGVPAILSYSDLAQGHFVRFAATLAGFAFLWLVVIPALGALSAMSVARKSPSAKGIRTTTLSAHDVVTEGEGFTTRQNWSAFLDIRKSGRRFYLVTHAYTAFVIPAAAFATNQDADVFLREAKRHITNANHKQIRAFYDSPDVQDDLPGTRSLPFRLTFSRYMLYSVPAVLRSFLRPGTAIICFSAFIALPTWLARERLLAGDWSVLWSAMSFAAYFVVLFSPLISAATWWRNRKKATFCEAITVSITPERLYVKGAESDITVRWGDVQRCSRLFGFMTFWTGPQGGIFAPSAAFTSPAEARGFYKQAIAYWKAARAAK